MCSISFNVKRVTGGWGERERARERERERVLMCLVLAIISAPLQYFSWGCLGEKVAAGNIAGKRCDLGVSSAWYEELATTFPRTSGFEEIFLLMCMTY